jgi:hypothetical protein
VVGLFNDNDDRAFYWTAAGGMIELPTLTGIESAARAINSTGQVAGYGDIATGDAHAVIWNRPSTPTTPEEQIIALEESVQDLVASGRLSPGLAAGLLRPLQNAVRSLEQGRVGLACVQVTVFQVGVRLRVLIGALTPAEGAGLITPARNIRAALGCS